MSAHRSPQPVEGGTTEQLTAALERIGNVARVLLRRAAAEHGLSVIQAELVLRLARLAGSGGELRELAAEFDVSAPTVSDSLAALRRKGLVEVTAPSTDALRIDRRRVRNQLTPSGRSVAGVLADWDAPLRRQLSGIAHQGQVLESLLGVIAGLVDEGVITVARTCLTCRFLGTEEQGTDEPGTEEQGTDKPGAARRYHCGLLGVPLPLELLRADCPEHQPATAGRSR